MENKQDVDVSALLRDPKVSPIAAREGVVLMTKKGPLCVQSRETLDTYTPEWTAASDSQPNANNGATSGIYYKRGSFVTASTLGATIGTNSITEEAQK